MLLHLKAQKHKNANLDIWVWDVLFSWYFSYLCFVLFTPVNHQPYMCVFEIFSLFSSFICGMHTTVIMCFGQWKEFISLLSFGYVSKCMYEKIDQLQEDDFISKYVRMYMRLKIL